MRTTTPTTRPTSRPTTARARLRPRVVAALTATAAAVVLGGTATPAHAAGTAVTTCGTTVTGEAWLTANLTCGDGIAVRVAEGATLDLRGHTLRGPGTRTSGQGVTLAPGATVRNGTITGFYDAVHAGPAGTVTVDRVTATENATGLSHHGWVVEPATARVVVTGSTFARNFTGVSAGYFDRIEVRSSRFVDNNWGLDVSLGTGGAVVRDSHFQGNSTGLLCSDMSCDVRGGVVRDNEAEGLWQGGGDLRVVGALVTHNGVGLHSGLGATHVERTAFHDNGTGVVSSYAAATTVETSAFHRNGTGFRGEPDSAGDVLRNNAFLRNGDGVVTQEPGTSLGRNLAVGSTGWGIHAPGAVDLGGNRAWGNGNQPQCVGVAC